MSLAAGSGWSTVRSSGDDFAFASTASASVAFWSAARAVSAAAVARATATLARTTSSRGASPARTRIVAASRCCCAVRSAVSRACAIARALSAS